MDYVAIFLPVKFVSISKMCQLQSSANFPLFSCWNIGFILLINVKKSHIIFVIYYCETLQKCEDRIFQNGILIALRNCPTIFNSSFGITSFYYIIKQHIIFTLYYINHSGRHQKWKEHTQIIGKHLSEN